ncbi:hypothetical protein DACRYDRAFT_78992 [Dacryopinax primogenitus]|uniref:Rhodanese domain-containing protein n=1 Tax=Dacryopinax primogenitus (strain DJM 731) TaxID=1858805 RepID=M5G8S1_DACPD|nr:uncharacterized protein DACRYDRAFT_78992 [Dacryopinax primogenitus]EJU02247.1 hypothetical protein DACRYDRAFT_78992 [Dacryopinax primogenitus]
MPLEDYKRYGRQMISENFGLPGQLRLRSARVLVVGAGGLGCPALQYLAAAGIGMIGVVDPDQVDISNLQRQVLHTTAREGWPKALSAKAAMEAINPAIQVIPHIIFLNSSNALPLFASYDLILDCTDNPQTRYLISDACVALGKPLISGAAIRYDGQLCVYNLPLRLADSEDERGPCYRCLWPVPPKQEEVGTCEEVGVLGTVTGVIGVLQAQAAIQLLAGLGPYAPEEKAVPTLLTYSALGNPMFRSLKLRPRRKDCLACGREGGARELVEEGDYVAFCGGAREDLEETGRRTGETRVEVQELQRRREGAVILDVRSKEEFSICHLPEASNVPLKTLLRDPLAYIPPGRDMYVLCKLGNDSQVAAHALRTALGNSAQVKDVVGGLRAWSKEIDITFPMY